MCNYDVETFKCMILLLLCTDYWSELNISLLERRHRLQSVERRVVCPCCGLQAQTLILHWLRTRRRKRRQKVNWLPPANRMVIKLTRQQDLSETIIILDCQFFNHALCVVHSIHHSVCVCVCEHLHYTTVHVILPCINYHTNVQVLSTVE